MPYKPNVDKILNKIISGEGTSIAEQFLKAQANKQLKNSEKKVYQMTQNEKELYAEMNQKEVADYEDFVRNKRKPIVKKGVELDYNGDTDVFFSPLASTVLDEFFTDGKN